MISGVYPAACCGIHGQRLQADTTRVFFGRHHIFQQAAEGHPSQLLRNLSSHKGERPGAALAFLPALKDGVSREVRDDSLNGVEGIVIFIHVDICQATPRRLEGCRRSAEQENLQPFLLDRQKDSNYYAD